MSEEGKELTNKQQRFVDEYLKCWNAAEAARRAGYSERSAYSQGWENLRKPEIKAQIQARLDEVHMSADEALKLTADIARGDIGDFMDISSVSFSLDLEEAKKAGKTNLIRRVSQKTITDGKADKETHIIDIELYDRQAALRDILKVHDKIKDPNEKVEIVIKYANTGNNAPTVASNAAKSESGA